MTEKQLKKLHRSDLLEMLLEVVKENDELKEQLAAARQEIDNRMLAIEPVGSLAEAALTLNGVFDSAQAACEQYLQNILTRSRNLEEFCERKERETLEKCNAMLEEAKAQAEQYLKEAKSNTNLIISDSDDN